MITASGDKAVVIERETLTTAIRRVSLLASERSRAVKIGLKPGQITLAASSPEMGTAEESVAAEYQGEPVEVGFNAQYLLDFLGVAGTEKVRMELRDAESQGILRPEGNSETEHRYVVMPMRL
jgi:DNA polymerase-3 subunit beta